MQNISRTCECCHKNYKVESTDETTICPQCNQQWEVESRWEASERLWREQETEMLQARGIIIEDEEDESDFCDWLCDVCSDPLYDCGHDVCGHCGTALSSDAIGTHEICPHCEYELEHPEDEIEYDDFAQVHDKDYPF